MGLAPGTTIGHYDVTALLGEGGMGQVWQATDTQLNRQVALKILPDAFAADPDRLARFTREAQILASLNHPNIAAIHGIEESEGTRALVLELVEGPTLADRIAKGPIPLDEALPIAKQIAEALEAAHEAGVIHRDLKPANIKVREDGTVKVLDFGLAKALDPSPEGDPSESPTLTAAATEMGVIMGTAAYMSPEQARGKTVDRRADIWAFGCVLFEMLTGQRPFQAEDVSLTLAAVMTFEPDLNRLPDGVSPALRTYLARCLVKDPRERVRDVGDMRLAMDGAFETTVSAPTEPAAHHGLQIWQRPVAAIVTALLLVAVTGLAVWSLLRPSQPTVARFPILLTADQEFFYFGAHVVAISPDGSNVVYAASDGLWLRRVDELRATLIPGTGSPVAAPFFSPDGQWIGFYSNGQLRKVSISGGVPVTLCDVADLPLSGVRWEADDTILFGQGPAGVWRVSGAGGTAEQVADVDEGEWAHGPQMLPGGEWLLFTLSPPGGIGWDDAQVVVESLATGQRTVLIDRGRDARYVSTGHLVYALNDVLLAVPFDPAARQVTGGPVAVVEGVGNGGLASGTAHFDLADTGSLVYAPGVGSESGVATELVWVDFEGREEPIGADLHAYGSPRISPEGTRIAVTRADGDRDVWVYGLGRGTLERLTFTVSEETNLSWTPDGAQLAFYSAEGRDGGGIFVQRVDGGGDAERLTTGNHRPYTWSSNGEHLTFIDMDGTGGGLDIGVVELGAEPSVTTLIGSPATEANHALSPDDKWLAYQTSETGQMEVFVRPFPDVGSERWLMSLEGGEDPVWHPDGSELFYRQGQAIMTVAVTDGPPSSWGKPMRLFAAPYVFNPIRSFDVAPDGTRFVMLKRPVASEDAAATQLIYVLNWTQELLERVPIP